MIELFEFKKKSKVLGIECGYYFKGEFVSRYKTKAMEILRARIKELSDDEKKKTDELKVLNQEYLKQTEKNKKTYVKQLAFHKRIREAQKPARILKLKAEIELWKSRMNERIKDVQNRYAHKIKFLENELAKENEVKA